MSQNKYDAIIVRTAEEDLKRDQYVNILSSMKKSMVECSRFNCISEPRRRNLFRSIYHDRIT